MTKDKSETAKPKTKGGEKSSGRAQLNDSGGKRGNIIQTKITSNIKPPPRKKK